MMRLSWVAPIEPSTPIIQSRASTPPDQSLFRLHPVLRRRRALRLTAFAVLLALLIISILDHAGVFGYRGNDRLNFENHSCHIIRASDIDDIALCTARGDEAAVQLIGVSFNDLGADGRSALKRAVTQLLLNQNVTLKFEPPQTRVDHRLLAYVYLSESELLQTRLLKEGLLEVDQSKCRLMPYFEAAQEDARHHKRGIWSIPPGKSLR